MDQKISENFIDIFAITDRLRVLRHHPDKRMGNGEVVIPECDYFACIVKAFETLSNPGRRRAYDSIDPTFDNFVPPKALSASDNFFTVSLINTYLQRKGVELKLVNGCIGFYDRYTEGGLS